MELTALQQAIELVEADIKANAANISISPETRNDRKYGMKRALLHLQSVLLAEKEQITSAYYDGFTNAINASMDISPSQYFTNTYNNQ